MWDPDSQWFVWYEIGHELGDNSIWDRPLLSRPRSYPTRREAEMAAQQLQNDILEWVPNLRDRLWIHVTSVLEIQSLEFAYGGS